MTSISKYTREPLFASYVGSVNLNCVTNMHHTLVSLFVLMSTKTTYVDKFTNVRVVMDNTSAIRMGTMSVIGK